MALWADLHERGIDLWSVLDNVGPHSAAEAWAVAEALPDTSRTAAARKGDADLAGFGFDRELAIATHNMLLALWRDTPMWKSAPKIDPIESPSEKLRKAQAAEERKTQVSSNRGVMNLFGM